MKSNFSSRCIFALILLVGTFLLQGNSLLAQEAEEADDEAAFIEADRLRDLPLRLGENAIANTDLPAWRRFAGVPVVTDKPRISIVLDDVGLNAAAVNRLLTMPSMTLALLPYADEIDASAKALKKAGHELMVHLPMEPMPGAGMTDPGPNALLASVSGNEFERRLNWNLSRFEGFVGVNNHMGSALTEQVDPMVKVMLALKQRGVFFLDSLTSANSVGRRAAAAVNLPFMARDIFIDNVQTREAVAAQLAEAEKVAERRGEVILIGHPYSVTLDALTQWIPGLSEKGFALVPLTQLMAERIEGRAR